MSKTRHKARRLATQALYSWHMSGQNLADIEREYSSDHDMSKVDVAYFQELLHRVPEKLQELDGHILPLLDRPQEEVDPVERAILRLSTYELAFRLDVPYRVVINEGVELAKTFGAEQGHKYVNSVLDGVAQKLRADEITAYVAKGGNTRNAGRGKTGPASATAAPRKKATVKIAFKNRSVKKHTPNVGK
ncbi:MAG: transcription antitermination factor NusB [Gammaproteobacteria bacterium]|nr:transcription antitermination factor NusB [Gammaproteobacteria bacterium]